MPLPILQPPPNTPLLPDPDRDSIWKRWFFQLWRLVKDGALGGTVTSVNVSGGTTGLTTSGGPITTSGTITLGGTLGPDNGGTGYAGGFTNGQVLIGDTASGDLIRNTLTAGTGITITNGGGTIEIEATGGSGAYPVWYIAANTVIPQYQCYTVIQQLEIAAGFTFELATDARAAIL